MGKILFKDGGRFSDVVGVSSACAIDQDIHKSAHFESDIGEVRILNLEKEIK